MAWCLVKHTENFTFTFTELFRMECLKNSGIALLYAVSN